MNYLDTLIDAEKLAKERVVRLQKELRSAQSDLVGAREELRIATESNRRAQLAKVVPIYGLREADIDHARIACPPIVNSLPEKPHWEK